MSKDRKATYVWSVCDIRPHKTETHLTIISEGGNLVEYLEEVSTPTADLSTIKIHVNVVISNTISLYMYFNVSIYTLTNACIKKNISRSTYP